MQHNGALAPGFLSVFLSLFLSDVSLRLKIRQYRIQIIERGCLVLQQGYSMQPQGQGLVAVAHGPIQRRSPSAQRSSAVTDDGGRPAAEAFGPIALSVGVFWSFSIYRHCVTPWVEGCLTQCIQDTIYGVNTMHNTPLEKQFNFRNSQIRQQYINR